MDKNNFVKPIPRKKADDDVLHTGRNDLIDNTSIVNRIKKFCKEIKEDSHKLLLRYLKSLKENMKKSCDKRFLFLFIIRILV